MNRGPIIAASALAAGMAFIDTTALTVALPALEAGLPANEHELLWIHNAYAVPLAALLLPGGSLGDRFGTRRLFLIGVILFALASLACALAPDAVSLIAFRFAQGVGAAIMIPGSLALIARAFPRESLGRAVGLWSAFTVVATALGPVVGGILSQSGLWRGVFLINLPLALVTVALTLGSVPRDSSWSPRLLDLLGALFLAIALAALSATFIHASLPFAALALLAMGLFVLRQRQARSPLLPAELLRSRPLVLATGTALFIYAAWGGFTYLLPSHLIRTFGFSPTQAGLLQLPAVVLLALLSPLAGKLHDRIGPRRPLLIGVLFSSLGFAAMGLVSSDHHPWLVLLPLILLGIGLGFCAAPLSSTIMGAVSAEHHGLAAGINSTAARMATAIGVALLGAIALNDGTPSFEVGFSHLCFSAALLSLLAGALVAGIKPQSEASSRT